MVTLVPDNTWQSHVMDKMTLRNEGLDTVITGILSHTVKARKDILIFTDEYVHVEECPATRLCSVTMLEQELFQHSLA